MILRFWAFFSIICFFAMSVIYYHPEPYTRTDINPFYLGGMSGGVRGGHALVSPSNQGLFSYLFLTSMYLNDTYNINQMTYKGILFHGTVSCNI